MFTNFQRKPMMSRGRNGRRGWPTKGNQYTEFEEKERYVRDQRCYQQQPFRYQSHYRHPYQQRYSHNQNTSYRHDQYRQHPPLQSRNYETYEPRQRSYYDNKENKNYPNYTRHSSPHKRMWTANKRRRSQSPPKFCNNFWSKSPVSSHSRKKRRLKEERTSEMHPLKSDSSDKRNMLKNERRVHETRPDEGCHTEGHIKSKRKHMVGKFNYKKKLFNNYLLNKKRFLLGKARNKKRTENGVTIEKTLTIPPISKDEFSQRSEEAESGRTEEEEDIISKIDDLEEGEILTDCNDKKMKEIKKRREVVQSEKYKIQVVSTNKSDETETKHVCEYSSSVHVQEQMQRVPHKEPVQKERHSYEEDTYNFFNRVTSDKISCARELKVVESNESESLSTRKTDINTNDEKCDDSFEIAQGEFQEPDSANEEITQGNKTNTGSDVIDEENVLSASNVKTLKQEKRESIDKLEETLYLAKSKVISANGMIQKIVSLANRSLKENGSENETNAHDLNNILSPNWKDKREILEKNVTVIENEAKESTCISSVEIGKSMKSSAIKSPSANEIPNEVSGRKEKIDLKTVKSVISTQNENNGNNDHFKGKVVGNTKEILVTKNVDDKYLNCCKYDTASSSHGTANVPDNNINDTEIEKERDEERKDVNDIDKVTSEPPTTSVPYSSQSGKPNDGSECRDNPSITRIIEAPSQSMRSDILGAHHERKEHSESDESEHLRKQTTFDDILKRRDNDTKESNKNDNHCSSVSKDVGLFSSKTLLLQKKLQQTTDTDISNIISKKGNGSESPANEISNVVTVQNEKIDLKSTKSISSRRNENNAKSDNLKGKVNESKEEILVAAKKNFENKYQNGCKYDTIASSPHNNDSETERKKDEERKYIKDIGKIMYERPTKPLPYSSQSCKPNVVSDRSDNPSITRIIETPNKPMRSDFSEAHHETKKNELELVRKPATFEVIQKRKHDEIKESNKNDNHCSTVSKSGAQFLKSLSLQKKLQQTTNTDINNIASKKGNGSESPANEIPNDVSGQNEKIVLKTSKKRNGSESTAQEALKGQKYQPSDGVFYPLGKPPDKKRKLAKTVLIEQSSSSSSMIHEHKQENEKVIHLQNPPHKSESKGFGMIETSPKVKTCLFNKNKRRISHFASMKTKSRENETPKVGFHNDSSVMSSNINDQVCNSSANNTFEKKEGKKTQKYLKSRLKLHRNTISEKGVDNKIHIETDEKRRCKKDSAETELKYLKMVRKDNIKIAETKDANEKQGKNNFIVKDKVKAITDSTASEIHRDSYYHTDSCNDQKEITKSRDHAVFIDETKTHSNNEMKSAPINCHAKNTGKHGWQDQNVDIDNRAQNLKEPTGLEMAANIVKENAKTKEKGSGVSEHYEKVNENELESEDDMDDIEPIEMLGFVFLNDISINDNASESGLINECGIECRRSDFKIDYCDDSVLFQNTCSENRIGNPKLFTNDIENKYENANDSGKKIEISEEHRRKIDNAQSSKKDSESNRQTEKEDRLHNETTMKCASRRGTNSERKRFSAKLETLGKLIDDEKVNENIDTLEKVKTNPTSDLKEPNSKNQQARTEKANHTKSTEWLKLAKTNMQSLVKIKTQTPSQNSKDFIDEDLPSARSLLQWDTPISADTSTQAKNVKIQSSSSGTSSYQNLSTTTVSSVSQPSLNLMTSKSESKTGHESSNQVNNLTATCRVKGIHRAVSPNNIAENNNTNVGSCRDQNSLAETPLPGYLDTERKTKIPSHLYPLLSNTETAQDLSHTSISRTLQVENSSSTRAWNLYEANDDIIENRQKRSAETVFHHHIIQKPVGTQDNQRLSKTNSLQPKQFELNTSKKEAVTLEQNLNMQTYEHAKYGVSNPILACNQLTEQSCQTNDYHTDIVTKNVAAVSPSVANIPMFSQLTAPLMDQNYTENNFTTMPSVMTNSQSNPFDVFENKVAANRPSATSYVTTQCNTLTACPQVEMQGVQNPLLLNTNTSLRQQAVKLTENQPHMNARNHETPLTTEVAKEEKRRHLYRELCDLDGINTGDFGLDVLLLAEKSRLRGLGLVDKEVLNLVKRGRAKNVQHTSLPNGETMQPNREHRNIEERILYLRSLKQNQR